MASDEAAVALEGVWVVMGWDMNHYPISLWPDELTARRAAADLGYGEVHWWPWGDWADRERPPAADEGSTE